jgi:hypothetical protein
MAQVKVSVVVKDNFLPKFDEIVKNLKKAGMTVDHELTAGIVLGSIDEKKVKHLDQISGIEVEKERSVQIAPPDSDIQ